MTPELRAKFEDTIKTGSITLYPGNGADIRKRFAGVACIVRLRYADTGFITLHAIDTADLHDLALERSERGSRLEIAAWQRFNASHGFDASKGEYPRDND